MESVGDFGIVDIGLAKVALKVELVKDALIKECKGAQLKREKVVVSQNVVLASCVKENHRRKLASEEATMQTYFLSHRNCKDNYKSV